MYGLRLDQTLMQSIKHLAVDENRAMNDLTEEALQDLLSKYRYTASPRKKRSPS